jgi:hypothetical protein
VPSKGPFRQAIEEGLEVFGCVGGGSSGDPSADVIGVLSHRSFSMCRFGDIIGVKDVEDW